MTATALYLPPLKAKGYRILRSAVRWLREDGQYCHANQPIGYCNLTLEPTAERPEIARLCAEEDLQVVFAPRVSGSLKLDNSLARGGYLSVRSIDVWEPGTQIASIQCAETGVDATAGQLRLLMLAGRRMTALADVHSGLLPGWHGRSRAWWCEAGESPVTLLSAGVCDVAGVVLGSQCAFLELFETIPAPTQIVHVPDHPIAPCVPILIDQLTRTPAQLEAIIEDVHRYFGAGAQAMSPDDWMFIGAMLSTFTRPTLNDSYSIFRSDGASQTGPADAVLLSLAVEPQAILRHRTLGYHLHVMRHHQAAAGPAVRAWLASAFEPIRRPISAVRDDYRRLIDTLDRKSGMRVIALNIMSTSGHEDISCYMGFDAPLGATLSNVAAKEINLALYDVGQTHDLDIIDLDAIGAEMGRAAHLPDGIHQSGELQTVLRQELALCLANLRAEQSLEFT